MSDEVDRLNRVVDDLIADRDPMLRSELSGHELKLARTAALLKSAEHDPAVPDEAFVESLAARLSGSLPVAETPRQSEGPPARVSRRGMLGRAAAAVAGLAVGGGAGAAAVYEQGKRDGQREEASNTLTAPMVPHDRGEWMDTGHTLAAVSPGQAVRFRAGALEGFLVNPGSHGSVYALSAACTHMGCMITWLENAGTFLCPCHGAQYNANGTVLSGIARHPLPRIDVRAEDGHFYVRSVAEHPAITTLAPYDRT